MSGGSTIPFREYLEAKYRIDGESLHRPTWNLFRTILNRYDQGFIVDMGTGTGGMVRRLLTVLPPGRFKLMGIDSDPGLLTEARKLTAETLRELGFSLLDKGDTLQGTRSSGGIQLTVEVLYHHASVLDQTLIDSLIPGQPLAVTAHALLDCLPPNQALRCLRRLLPPKSFLYTSINYNGRTEFLPRYNSCRVEESILEAYDRSMDERKIGGLAIAGSECGGTLYGALLEHGFEPISVGASDWSLGPVDGRYAPDVLTVIKMLLETIYGEVQDRQENGFGEVDPEELDRWYSSRLKLIGEGRLAAIVHQTDILARS